MNRRHTSLEEQKVDKKLFGTRINKARKDRGLTAEKLAEACNINSTYLRQIEGGTPLYCCQSKKACLDFDERGERPIRYQEA